MQLSLKQITLLSIPIDWPIFRSENSIIYAISSALNLKDLTSPRYRLIPVFTYLKGR